MKFLHPNVIDIDDLEFIAGWIVWFKEYGSCNQDWTVDPMPVRNAAAGLNEQIQNYGVFTCDVLCRVLRRNNRDTMQATAKFRNYESNSNIIETVNENFPGAAIAINTVRITDNAIEKWRTSSSSDRSEAFNLIYSLIADDLFIVPDAVQQVVGDKVISIDPVSNFNNLNISYKGNAGENLHTRNDYLKALADSLQHDPYQPMYRKRPIGNSVSGWDNRLNAYFWPIPESGLTETWNKIQPIIETCNRLTSKIIESEDNEPWDVNQEVLAVQVAINIFKWGGVPQRENTVTANNVRMVFENAIGDDVIHENALMNSGWTKVAAFASHNTANEQVIWDSRVSISLIYRLDALINGNQDHLNYFEGIGYVSGRGGFRQYRMENLNLNWPNGYRIWSAQIAGSQLVREIVNILNDSENTYPRMPSLTGSNELTNWTVRGVEMVLFGDGY